MNPQDLTPEDRKFLARESMPRAAYDRLDAHPSMPRAAYRQIALRAAKRSQRRKTVKALALLTVTVLSLLVIASLPYLLH